LDIVRCTDCGLLFTNPRDDDATLARVYAGLQDLVYDFEEDNRRRTASAFFSLVRQFRSQPARLLDIGCASGLFVEVAARAGWQVTGLEASNWAVNQAQRRAPQATFVTGMLEDVSFPAASFEVITLWDVMEHVRSPRETLLRIREWLTPGGWLFFNLPDAASRPARWMGKHWVLLLREHLWYFSPSTFTRLAEQCDLELVYTRSNFVHFSLANVFGRFAQYPGAAGRAAPRISRWKMMRHVKVRFPMGEMNAVVKRHA
jgi:SAM-dependent methyltransferase